MKETGSTWLEGIKQTRAITHLTKDISVDIAIIGGGITGITTAYRLSKTGKKVLLLDKGDLMHSTTAYTTAFLTYVIDTNITELIKSIGATNTKKVWESHKEAIDMIEEISKKEKIDCEFTRCDEYITATTEKERKALEEMLTAAKKIGFELAFLTENLPSFSQQGMLVVPNQAKFHPLKYCLALQEKAINQGVTIVHNTQVEKVTKGTPNIINTNRGVVTAHHAIIATYDPFNHPMKLFAKKGMYTSYVFEVEIAKNSIKEGLYLDQANPYHYFRIDKGEKKDSMILGGEDHRQEIPMDHEKNYKALEEYLNMLLPKEKYRIVRKWSGPILEPSDGLAYIGKLYPEEHVSVAMAFSGNGMTYSMIAAQLFYDFIMEKKNEYEELYNPMRIPTFLQLFQKGKDYTEELLGGAVKNMTK